METSFIVPLDVNIEEGYRLPDGPLYRLYLLISSHYNCHHMSVCLAFDTDEDKFGIYGRLIAHQLICEHNYNTICYRPTNG